MNIVVLENGDHNLEFSLISLKKAFPKAAIIDFCSVESFLKSYRDLPRDYVLVIEKRIVLLELRDSLEQLHDQYRKLASTFPWIEKEWDDHNAGEKIIQYVHNSYPNIRILIYTHSEKSNMNAKIFENPKVGYLMKHGDYEPERLREAINKL